MESHLYDLDRGKITDLDKFLKKLHNTVLSLCTKSKFNLLFIFKDFEIENVL